MNDDTENLKPESAKKADIIDSPAQAMAVWARFRDSHSYGFGKRVLYRLSRLSCELVAIVLGVAFFWFAALNVLVSRSAVDVSFLKRNAEILFSDIFDGHDANLGTMYARYNARDNAIEFSLADIVVSDKAGREIERVSQISGRIDIWAALRGTLEMKTIALTGGQVTWLKDETGQVTAGLGTPRTVGRFGPVWREKGQARADQAAWPDGLRNIELSGVELFIEDRSTNFSLKGQNTRLTAAKNNDTIDLLAHVDLMRNQHVAPVKAHLSTNNDLTDFQLRVEGQAVVPSQMIPDYDHLAGLRSIDAPVAFDMIIEATQSGGLETANVSVDVGAGDLVLGKDKTAIGGADVTAHYETSSGTLELTDFNLQSDIISLSGDARLSNIGRPETGFFKNTLPFRLDLVDVTVDAGAILPDILTVDNINLSGDINLASRALRLGNGVFDFTDFIAELRGDIDLINAERGFERIALRLDIDQPVSHRDILGLWPMELISGARRWVDGAVLQSSLDKFSAYIDVEGPQIDLTKLSPDTLFMGFDVLDADVAYIRTMSPVRGISGRVDIKGNRLFAAAQGGQIDGLLLDRGTVDMPKIFPHGGDMTIDVYGAGPIPEMLRIIDQRPFQFASKYGIEPESFGGAGEIHLTITRPLLEFFDQSRIKYSVSGDFTEASGPFSIGQFKAADGDLHLEADSSGMRINGPLRFGDWNPGLMWEQAFSPPGSPSQFSLGGMLGSDVLDSFGVGFRSVFGGEIDMRIEGQGRGVEVLDSRIIADLKQAELTLGTLWHKIAGQPGKITGRLRREEDGALDFRDFEMTAMGLDIAGNAAIAGDFRLLGLDLIRAKVDGVIDAAIQARPDDTGERLALFMTGKFLDISPFIGQGLQTQSAGIDVPLLLTASIEDLWLNPAYRVQDSAFVFSHNGTAMQQARFKGRVSEGDFSVELITDPISQDRTVSVKVPDASEAAFAFLGLDNIEGGVLDVQANLPKAGSAGAITGLARVTNFNLIEAPIMTQMLSLASLEGLGNLMAGKGLRFNEMEVPFAWETGKLSIHKARASGAALGMTADGDILFANQELDIDGVLIPAYTANSILGSIPVIGGLIIGNKGEGVFGLSYTVNGGFSQTQVAINPLSALTPGFLRGIFRPQRDEIAEDVREALELLQEKNNETSQN